MNGYEQAVRNERLSDLFMEKEKAIYQAKLLRREELYRLSLRLAKSKKKIFN
jgi:hypothetical protein